MNADLLGKLRALEEKMSAANDATNDDILMREFAKDAALFQLADLLPAICAELERLGKDAWRLDSGTIRLSMLDELGDISATLFTQVNLRAAIDAAMGE